MFLQSSTFLPLSTNSGGETTGFTPRKLAALRRQVGGWRVGGGGWRLTPLRVNIRAGGLVGLYEDHLHGTYYVLKKYTWGEKGGWGGWGRGGEGRVRALEAEVPQLRLVQHGCVPPPNCPCCFIRHRLYWWALPWKLLWVPARFWTLHMDPWPCPPTPDN